MPPKQAPSAAAAEKPAAKKPAPVINPYAKKASAKKPAAKKKAPPTKDTVPRLSKRCSAKKAPPKKKDQGKQLIGDKIYAVVQTNREIMRCKTIEQAETMRKHMPPENVAEQMIFENEKELKEYAMSQDKDQTEVIVYETDDDEIFAIVFNDGTFIQCDLFKYVTKKKSYMLKDNMKERNSFKSEEELEAYASGKQYPEPGYKLFAIVSKDGNIFRCETLEQATMFQKMADPTKTKEQIGFHTEEHLEKYAKAPVFPSFASFQTTSSSFAANFNAPGVPKVTPVHVPRPPASQTQALTPYDQSRKMFDVFSSPSSANSTTQNSFFASPTQNQFCMTNQTLDPTSTASTTSKLSPMSLKIKKQGPSKTHQFHIHRFHFQHVSPTCSEPLYEAVAFDLVETKNMTTVWNHKPSIWNLVFGLDQDSSPSEGGSYINDWFYTFIPFPVRASPTSSEIKSRLTTNGIKIEHWMMFTLVPTKTTDEDIITKLQEWAKMANDPKIRERYHKAFKCHGFKQTIIDETGSNGVYWEKLASAIEYNCKVIHHNYLNELFMDDKIPEICMIMWDIQDADTHGLNPEIKLAAFPP